MSVKSRGKGVGVQYDLRGRVTENPSARATITPLDIPKFWDRDVDLTWEQSNDPTLVNIRVQVWSVEGKAIDTHPLTFPHYVISGQLLYRVTKALGTGPPVKQLLVPGPF